jgi:hypothetical protein
LIFFVIFDRLSNICNFKSCFKIFSDKLNHNKIYNNFYFFNKRISQT